MTAASTARPLVLYGGGGFGREVALLVHALNRVRPTWHLLGFIDDNRSRGEIYRGLPFLGGMGQIARLADEQETPLSVAICMGNCELLGALSERIRRLRSDIEFPTLVHPSASIDREWIEMGEGNIVEAGVSVTSDVRVGSFNIVNLHATIAHDVVVGNRCQINPGVVVNGGVHIGDGVTIGAGAILMPRISLGAGATVALGSVVGRDVLSGELVAGNPSRVIRNGLAHA